MRRSGVDDLLSGLRFFSALGPHLRRPVTVERARAIVRDRLERREADFLALVRGAICHALRRRAGCEYGDVEQLVRQQGLDGALAVLYRAGVYLTVAEPTGRVPAVRGGCGHPGSGAAPQSIAAG